MKILLKIDIEEKKDCFLDISFLAFVYHSFYNRLTSFLADEN